MSVKRIGPSIPNPRLVIGTAQLVARYGILDSRTSQEISTETGKKILDRASSLGFGTIDTSPSYGLAEKTIGSTSRRFTVDTKIPSFSHGVRTLRQSIRNLGESRVRTVFLHSRLRINSDEKHGLNQITKLKGTSFDRLGISIYEPEEIETALSFLSPDSIQIPFSILDRRFQSENVAHYSSLELSWHARSVYAQGLLTNGKRWEEKIPRGLRTFLRAFWKLCDSYETRYDHASLGWVRRSSHITEVIVGVSTEIDLLRMYNSSEIVIPEELLQRISDLEPPKWNVVDPRQW